MHRWPVLLRRVDRAQAHDVQAFEGGTLHGHDHGMPRDRVLTEVAIHARDGKVGISVEYALQEGTAGQERLGRAGAGKDEGREG